MPEAGGFSKPDAAMLLNWSLGTESAALFDDLPDTAKPQIAAWLGDSAGAVGTLVMQCVLAGNTQDAVPLGLVCGVVLSPQGEGVHELAAAAIRLERFMGDKRIGMPMAGPGPRCGEAVEREHIEPLGAQPCATP
jgi:hypothetical protein